MQDFDDPDSDRCRGCGMPKAACDCPIDRHKNIRAVLGDFIGKTVADVLQHDSPGTPYVQIIFTDATWLRFPIGDDGFDADRDE
jgi:hypothetical protein